MGRTAHAPNRADTLRTYCWCRCQMVTVAAATVRAGRTESCGRDLCSALAFTAMVGSADPSCDECAERARRTK